MDVSKIEVKHHGRWISVLDLRAPTWPANVAFVSEGKDGYLQVVTGKVDLFFRPVEWRTLED